MTLADDIEESLRITGRGTGVFGEWRSGQFTSCGGGYVQLTLGTGATVPVRRIDIAHELADYPALIVSAIISLSGTS